jgi:hypothetical protein
MVEAAANRDPWTARLVRGALETARDAAAASVPTPPDPVPASRATPVRWRVAGPDPVPRLAIAVIAAIMILVIASLIFEAVTGEDVLPDGPALAPPRTFPVLEPSPPVKITARSIQLSAAVHGLGTTPEGAIAVPSGERFDQAGWYDESPTPGQYGPSVIVGHVDSRTGPAVFHDVPDLRPGNRVEVTRADGSVAVFAVNRVRRYDKADLPADDVFGDFSRPGLRLITCGGRWAGGTTGYADNVVAYASMVDARRA